MGYCATTDVAALCSHIVLAEGDFGPTTHPNKSQVQTFVSSGSALLNAIAQGKGWTPPGSTNALWDVFRQANALYAAALAERQRTVDQSAPGIKSRSDLLWGDFKFHLQLLFGSDVEVLDLASAGLSATNSSAGIYVGGISKDDIETREADTDRVAPRFVRGQSTSFADTLRPGKITSTD